MTELERKALLGDKQAQELCTEMGIAIACPCCSGKAITTVFLGNHIVVCEKCSMCTAPVPNRTQKEALADWNTRPAPPIGRCGDCIYFRAKNSKKKQGVCYCGEMEMNFGGEFYPYKDDYCSYFEPKESEENDS